MQSINIKLYSVAELKALKCDIYERMDMDRGNLALISAEIQLRQQEEAKNKVNPSSPVQPKALPKGTESPRTNDKSRNGKK